MVIQNNYFVRLKSPMMIGADNGRFNEKNNGPTLKPSSSRLGTCQGQRILLP